MAPKLLKTALAVAMTAYAIHPPDPRSNASMHTNKTSCDAAVAAAAAAFSVSVASSYGHVMRETFCDA